MKRIRENIASANRLGVCTFDSLTKLSDARPGLSGIPLLHPGGQMHDDLKHAKWRKSSRSGAGNTCVEIAELPYGGAAVRDSKDPTEPVLAVPLAQWAAFVGAISVSRGLG
jgi:hypothetical protein